MCDSFIVYRSFYEGIKMFDAETRLAFFDTLMEYGLNGVEKPTDNCVAKALFTAIKPQIDANAKRRANGNLGGRPKKEPMVSEENNHRFSELKTNGFDFEKPNVNVNANENANGNDNVNANDNDVLTDNKKRVEANASKREILDALIAKWNSYVDRGNIPLIKSVSTDSKCGKSVIARVQEHGLEEVVEVMDSVFESDFLRGKDGKWNAKFDWMFLPNNFEKIMNGNYSNRKTSSEEQMDVLFSVADEAIGDGDPFKYFSGKEFL